MKKDPLLRKVTKEHKRWLSGIKASTYGGQVMSLENFGITTKRIEILESMGLIEYKGGLYILTEKGENQQSK